ncbi:MAG: hypothetical protein AAGD28_23245, partial [Bacteroidota bacterium]
MKRPIIYPLICLLLISCAKQQETQEAPESLPSTQKSQAIVKVQDKAYDNEAKSELTHAYKNLQHL